jgi:hypothetical protein
MHTHSIEIFCLVFLFKAETTEKSLFKISTNWITKSKFFACHVKVLQEVSDLSINQKLVSLPYSLKIYFEKRLFHF